MSRKHKIYNIFKESVGGVFTIASDRLPVKPYAEDDSTMYIQNESVVMVTGIKTSPSGVECFDLLYDNKLYSVNALLAFAMLKPNRPKE